MITLVFSLKPPFYTIMHMIVYFGPIAKKGATSVPRAENLNKLFTVKGGKFKLSVQERDLAPFVSNRTKVKMPSEIKLPLDGRVSHFEV